jgi:hypothetical protein
MAAQGIWNIQQPDGYTHLKNHNHEFEKNLWRRIIAEFYSDQITYNFENTTSYKCKSRSCIGVDFYTFG